MKKRNRALGIAILALSSVLASCNEDFTYPKNKWQENVVVTVGGKEYKYKEIYDLMNGKKESAQAYYTTAKNILAQLVTPITDSMRSKVQSEMDELHNTWKANARSNGTSYKEEQEKTLDSEKVDTEDELVAKKLASQQNTQNSKNYFAEADGVTDSKEKYYISEQATKDFVTNQAPYHVSHILAKVDASGDGAGLWKGEISSDNAKKIGDVVRMLATGSSFGDTAQVLSDDGSKTSGGELSSTDSGSEQIAMLKSTSYVNEFKLGLYAYDAYLNPALKPEEKEAAAKSLRVPNTVDSSSVKNDIENTVLGKGKAFGIPLSAAYTMQFYRDQTDALDGSDIKDAKATSYIRNIYFNNYFNNHSVNFIYNVSVEDYTKEFLDELAVYCEARHIAPITSIDDLRHSNDAGLMKKAEEYKFVSQLLEETDSQRFVSKGPSLVNYQYDSTAKQNKITSLDDKKILTDEKGNPVIVTRAGADSYQGIHFIIVNNDPFDDAEHKYQYYRVNTPKEGSDVAAESTDYSTNPSFVNFVTADKGTTTTYTNRVNAVEAVINSSDSHSDYTLWEQNILTFNKNHEKDHITFENVIGGDVLKAITDMIANARKSSTRSDDESLDSSWETYIQKMGVQEENAKRVLPGVCSVYFEAGDVEGKEGMCHVKA